MSEDGCKECGGLGCVGEDSEPQCGGQDCKGVVTQTNNVWKKAEDLDKDIMDSLKEVDKLQRMVCVITGIRMTGNSMYLLIYSSCLCDTGFSCSRTGRRE